MRENRIKTILLYNKHTKKKEIKEILLLDLQTIRRYINDFKLHRMDSIDFEDNRKNNSGNKTGLNKEQIEKLTSHLKENTISQALEIKEYVLKEFNIKYSISGITSLLHRLNFTYKKVIAIPKNSNTTKAIEQQLYFEQNYEKFKEDIDPNDKVYFLDGVHPTHNTKVGYAWIKKSEEKIIESNSGRTRINLNGAYDVIDNDIIVLPSKTMDFS